MQPSRSRRPSREFADRSSTLQLLVHLTDFANQTSQIRETKNRAYEFAARRSLHAGSVPNEVRWKNLLRHLEFRCLPEIRPDFHLLIFVYWSWRRDSNPRPSVYKTDALPTELRQHCGDKRPSGHKYTP